MFYKLNLPFNIKIGLTSAQKQAGARLKMHPLHNISAWKPRFIGSGRVRYAKGKICKKKNSL